MTIITTISTAASKPPITPPATAPPEPPPSLLPPVDPTTTKFHLQLATLGRAL